MTGTQRSGTTWLGNILSADPNIGYIHEPFNTTNVHLHNSPLKIPYQYINTLIDNSNNNVYSDYLDYFNNPGLRFFYNSLYPIKKIDSRYVLPGYQNFKAGINKNVKVIKDPFALLSCEWLHLTHQMDIVITIRHPAAFALSMKEKNWIVTPTVFQKQNSELSHIYTSHQDVISSYLKMKDKKSDLIGSAILGWNLLHIAIDYFRDKYSNWIFVRHEDLSKNPLGSFKKIYRTLDLQYKDVVVHKIKKSTSGHLTSGNRRNTQSNLVKWKEQLTSKEIERIKSGTSSIWPLFYELHDW